MGEERCPGRRVQSDERVPKILGLLGQSLRPGLLPGLDRLGGVALGQPRRLMEEGGAPGLDLQAGIDGGA